METGVWRRVATSLLSAALISTPGLHAQLQRPAEPASSRAEGAGGHTPDCPRLWRDYRRSQACFARYRNVNGMDAEAFRVCGRELPDPSALCGPVRDGEPALQPTR